MSYTVEPRNTAREKFSRSGLAYADLGRDDLERLRKTIDRHLMKAGTIEGYRMDRGMRLVDWPSGWAALTCKAYYFEKREAVTFGRDGFIGFAGWADDRNVAPILDGFSEWVTETTKQKAAERALMLESGAA